MHLSELKAMHVGELIKMGEALEIENVGRLRKQELMFAIMKKRAKAGEQVFGDGVLEVLPDGFGFLRAPDTSYMASAPTTSTSRPSQIRRFNLHTGDMIEGEVRVPKDGERYFALAKVDKRQRRHARGEQAQDHVREPDAAVPEGADSSSSATIQAAKRTSPAASSTSSRRIGKGQRALLVAPPKSGKTVMMQHIAHAHRRQLSRHAT